jgi:hypothetical protein
LRKGIEEVSFFSSKKRRGFLFFPFQKKKNPCYLGTPLLTLSPNSFFSFTNKIAARTEQEWLNRVHFARFVVGVNLVPVVHVRRIQVLRVLEDQTGTQDLPKELALTRL